MDPVAEEGFGEWLEPGQGPLRLEKNPISPQQPMSLFSWDTGLPHLGLLLLQVTDESALSHSCPYQKNSNPVLMQDH